MCDYVYSVLCGAFSKQSCIFFTLCLKKKAAIPFSYPSVFSLGELHGFPASTKGLGDTRMQCGEGVFHACFLHCVQNALPLCSATGANTFLTTSQIESLSRHQIAWYCIMHYFL